MEQKGNLLERRSRAVTIWHGEKPSIQHVRVFGCVAHVKNARPMLKKLDDRSTPMVFRSEERRVGKEC